jgi:hypothetical protein
MLPRKERKKDEMSAHVARIGEIRKASKYLFFRKPDGKTNWKT